MIISVQVYARIYMLNLYYVLIGENYGICLQPSLRMLFRQTLYEVKFYVDFRGCVFGLSFQSNVWIDYTCFLFMG